jgi:hypothetical protein
MLQSIKDSKKATRLTGPIQRIDRDGKAMIVFPSQFEPVDDPSALRTP